MTSIKLASSAIRKTSDEVRVRDLSFADGMASGETITSVAFSSISPSGALTLDTAVGNGQVVQVTLSGGDDGTVYVLTLRVTTSGGQTLEGSVRVSVRD